MRYIKRTITYFFNPDLIVTDLKKLARMSNITEDQQNELYTLVLSRPTPENRAKFIALTDFHLSNGSVFLFTKDENGFPVWDESNKPVFTGDELPE